MGKAVELRLLLKFIVLFAIGQFILNQVAFADDNISISIASETVNMNIMPGDYGSADEIITVSTTSPAGYKVDLGITGQSSNLVHTVASGITIPTFVLPDGEDSIPVESLGFGYGYSVDGGANYMPVPEPNSLVQIFETFAAGENQHTLTFGAKLDNDVMAGDYTNTFVVTAVAKLAPCTAGNICYYGNGDDGTGTMGNQAVSSDADVTLMAPNFSRAEYGFEGWNTEADGTGITYGPSQTIHTGDLSMTGLQLYAKWIASAGDLQGWDGCGTMEVGDVTALTDTRDGNTYAVAKQADGKCWMMENLRLDLSDPDLEISEISTNNPTASFAAAIDNNHPTSTNSFCESNSPNAACVNVIAFNTNNINRALTAAYSTNDASSSWYSYGVYYNWYTATVGHGTYEFAKSGSIVDGDICPAGWRMPTGHGDNGDLAKLDKALGGIGKNYSSGTAGTLASERWRAYPLNYLYSGEWRGNTGYNRDISGDYNTANVGGSQNSVNLWLQKTALGLNANTTKKPRGQTVRCVANDNYSAIGSIHYDSNGGIGTMVDATDVNLITATAANNEFTKDGAEFMYWNTKADGSGTIVLEGSSVASAANHMGISDGETLTLYAIWASVYHIVYAGNGSDAGVMNENLHGDLVNLTSINLIAPNYSKNGYGFIGWSVDSAAASKLTSGQTVDIYGPNEKVTLDNAFYMNADSNNTITLYAVWLAADSTYTMQTFGSSECNDLAVGDTLALTDTRDGNTYAVAKLADNNCWMVENLRLVPSSVAFDSTNTNSPTAAFISGSGASASSDTLCGTDGSSCVDKIAYNTNNINRNLTPIYNNNAKTSMWYAYGVMYNWYTASAGNGDFAMESGSVSGDICPVGWRLPTGGNGGEFSALNTVVNGGITTADAALRNFPNNFIYSGDYNKTTYGGRSTYGRYWSATAASTANAFRFGLSASEVTPVKSYNKWDAFAVRCIVNL